MRARTLRTPLLFLFSAVVFVNAAPVVGQNRQFALEANPVYATLAYGWRTGETRYMGFAVGAGIPGWDITLLPADHDIMEWAHVGFFMRSQPNRNTAFDARLTAGLGGEENDCSGCLPADGGFVALGGGASFGGTHVKLGPRIRIGYARARDGSGDVFVNVTPLALLLTYEWTSRPFPF